MSLPALVVHGHFYQPPRLDPFTETMPVDPTAAPARDWNERISGDCYRPNAVLGNLAAMSWDVGPTLAGWLETSDPTAYAGFVAGDGPRHGMAQPFHHAIMPLASHADRRTEIRWGLRDFEIRFGRRPTGMWLPETAVDLPTLRLMADAGITYTILAPWQVTMDGLDTRRPARIDLGDGRSMVVAIYDGLLSAAVSFQPEATVDADRFVAERLEPRFAQEPLPDGVEPLVVIATDGELYGHHQPSREHFLARLVGSTAPQDRRYATPTLERALAEAAASEAGLPLATLRERTSWSCHHGVERWASGCGCVADGHWKAPLRAALERLAGGIDAVSETLLRALPGGPDLWSLRDAYADVVIGALTPGALAATVLGSPGPGRGGVDSRVGGRSAAATTLLEVLAAQRWRLSMFASCAWFWDRPDRIETAATLRAATRSARAIDALAGTALESRLIEDLRQIGGPDGRDGGDLLGAALAAVGQTRLAPRNPSARDLRAAG